jgi:hypothetical protein
MLQRVVTIIGVALLLASAAAQHASAQPAALTDDQVRALLVRASVALYKGVCPCPWSLNGEGRRCGEASAYARKLTIVPACFAREVTRSQVERYRTLLAEEERLAK